MGKAIDILQTVIIILLIIFGLFVAYQIILKIFGGSWSTEDIIVALLIFNIGFVFTLALNQARTSSKLNYLGLQFKCLAKDFKEHLSGKKD